MKWLTNDDFEKLAQDEYFIKEASQKTGGLVKTAEDAELFRQGQILGMGMKDGFRGAIVKLADELSDALIADNVAPENPDPNVVTPTQVPTVDVVDPALALQELKNLADQMLPGEFYQFIVENGLEPVIENIPELSTKYLEGQRIIEGESARIRGKQQSMEAIGVPAESTMGNQAIEELTAPEMPEN